MRSPTIPLNFFFKKEKSDLKQTRKSHSAPVGSYAAAGRPAGGTHDSITVYSG